LQKNVETLAARMILSDQVRSGEVILIDAVDGKLEASVKGQMSEV
jgi:ATP-dependent Clp protease ATP-binding subunit ClpB